MFVLIHLIISCLPVSSSAKEVKRANARNLKKLGIAIDVISQATGLSKEEIEKL